MRKSTTDDPWKRPEKRPGPYAQDPSREPPSKAQRDKDYLPEKNETGKALKKGAGRTEKPGQARKRHAA